MSAVIGIALAAVLFALAAFLKTDRSCGGSCGGCALGTCDRSSHHAGDHR
jgi:hypothetical protein